MVRGEDEADREAEHEAEGETEHGAESENKREAEHQAEDEAQHDQRQKTKRTFTEEEQQRIIDGRRRIMDASQHILHEAERSHAELQDQEHERTQHLSATDVDQPEHSRCIARTAETPQPKAAARDHRTTETHAEKRAEHLVPESGQVRGDQAVQDRSAETGSPKGNPEHPEPHRADIAGTSHSLTDKEDDPLRQKSSWTGIRLEVRVDRASVVDTA